MKFWLLIFIILLTIISCVTRSSNDSKGMVRGNIDYNTNKIEKSDDVDRFLPDYIEDIYIMTFANRIDFTNIDGKGFFDIEEEFLKYIKENIIIETEFELAKNTRTAGAILGGVVKKYSSKVNTEDAFGDPDFVQDYLLIEISLYDNIEKKYLVTNKEVYDYIYYNRITPPISTRKYIVDEFVSNLSGFIFEIIEEGWQTSIYDYSETNKMLLENDGFGLSIEPKNYDVTNDDSILDFEDYTNTNKMAGTNF